MSDRPGRVVVVCVGNALVGDDAVGCAVHERLAAGPLPEGVRLELLGVGGLQLLDLLGGEEALVAVDAVQLGAAPGTVHVLSWFDLPASIHAVTSHGLGLREALEVCRRLHPERMPDRAVLVGIEGRCFDRIGGALTPAVAAAVEPATARVRELIAELRR